MSRLDDSENAPAVGTKPLVGLNPTAPDSEAGIRIEPPVSLPMAMSAMPPIADTTAPAEEPPGMRVRSRGLAGIPSCGFVPNAEKANSVICVLPMTMAPAARNRLTTSASSTAGGRPRRTAEPELVTVPATSNSAFIETMRPSSGPRSAPAAARRSAASASQRALSANTAVKTLFASGEWIRASAASSRATAEGCDGSFVAVMTRAGQKDQETTGRTSMS
ncbi:hypothetical protein ABIA40_005014 [Bradyrhizobium sp. USDA 223]